MPNPPPTYDAVLLGRDDKEYRATTQLPTLNVQEPTGEVTRRALLSYKLEHGGTVVEQLDGRLLDSRGREYMLM